MCRGTFGCPITSVGSATTVTISLRCLIEGITVDFVAGFSVVGVLKIGFLHYLVRQKLLLKSGIRSGSAITVSCNGSKV